MTNGYRTAFEPAMRAALEEATGPAAPRSEVPVGAVILDPAGALIARAHNRRESDADCGYSAPSQPWRSLLSLPPVVGPRLPSLLAIHLVLELAARLHYRFLRLLPEAKRQPRRARNMVKRRPP